MTNSHIGMFWSTK